MDNDLLTTSASTHQRREESAGEKNFNGAKISDHPLAPLVVLLGNALTNRTLDPSLPSADAIVKGFFRRLARRPAVLASLDDVNPSSSSSSAAAANENGANHGPSVTSALLAHICDLIGQLRAFEDFRDDFLSYYQAGSSVVVGCLCTCIFFFIFLSLLFTSFFGD